VTGHAVRCEVLTDVTRQVNFTDMEALLSDTADKDKDKREELHEFIEWTLEGPTTPEKAIEELFFGKTKKREPRTGPRTTLDEILSGMGMDPLTQRMVLWAAILSSLLSLLAMDLPTGPLHTLLVFVIGAWLWSKKILRKRQEKTAAETEAAKKNANEEQPPEGRQTKKED